MGATISVITPVYNGERYLADCIESVRAQTRTDWEYVIADNCSTDRTAEIARHYAALDSRIRHVRCTEFVNIYRSFSRAIGFMDPGSRYCKFVCADDWLYPECLEQMVGVAEKHPSVGYVSAYRLYGDRVDALGLEPYAGQEVLSGRDALRRALLEDLYPAGSPTTILFAADVLRSRDPFFDQTAQIHSDADAGLRTLLQSDLGMVHKVLTVTRLHSETHTFSFADRMNTYQPMFVASLLRYGPQVLTKQERRRALRARLRNYGWFLFKAGLKPSRRGDKLFQAFHNTETRRLLAEVPGEDRETRLILRSMRATLADRSGTYAMP